ncbi:MAG: ParB/RepB/Spo0J family partition protein [Bacteroidota bacterium]
MIKHKSSQRKSALGRGLNALLEDASLLLEEKRGNLTQEIAIEKIQRNPFQPRKDFEPAALQELCDSIKIHGIIQPLTVRQLTTSAYQLIAGERRLKAAKMVGLTHIPVYIRMANDQQMLEIALVENIQRENLNPIEIALSYQRLLTECQIKQEALGARLGKSRVTVNNYLRLLKLPPEIQIALRDRKIGMGHARALINVEAIDTQLDIFKKIIEEDLSVRAVELLVRNVADGKSSSVAHKAGKTQLKGIMHATSTQLSNRLGAQVKIQLQTKEKGKIEIAFVSATDLSRIIKMLLIN